MNEDVKATEFLSGLERERLKEMVHVFLAEKSYEGCNGLVVSDRMRVLVASEACMLILGRDHDLYRRVETILLYPSTVFAERAGTDERSPVLGEAHYRGPVILAWDSVRHGAYNPTDGRNLVYHEFAHKLDMLTGEANGTPPLDDREARRRWAEALEPVFLQLRRDSDRGRKTFLDEYGATNEAEFFAVATEFFFEKPTRLRRLHADLYRELRLFYNQDPAARVDIAGET